MSEEKNYSKNSVMMSNKLTQGLLPEGCDLTPCNTFGLASYAPACVTLTQHDQLEALSDLAMLYSQLLVLGGGSNMVLPARVPGLVVRVALRGLQWIEMRDDACIVEAAAGELWHDVVSACIDQGWDGLENLALIPGTVGAAPVQNIGAYGVELADRFDSLLAWHVTTRRLVRMTVQDCRFAYRDSVFKQVSAGEWIIVSVRLRLPRPWRAVLDYPDLQRDGELAATQMLTARAVFDAVCRIRRAKLPDPVVMGNAGSFFKNPIVSAETRDSLLACFPGLVSYMQADGRYKLAAGWLIDQCGWKGRSFGRVGVHDRQALVLVNQGGATAQDVMALVVAIQADVKARYGVVLEPEPIIIAGG